MSRLTRPCTVSPSCNARIRRRRRRSVGMRTASVEIDMDQCLTASSLVVKLRKHVVSQDVERRRRVCHLSATSKITTGLARRYRRRRTWSPEVDGRRRVKAEDGGIEPQALAGSIGLAIRARATASSSSSSGGHRTRTRTVFRRPARFRDGCLHLLTLPSRNR